MHRCTPEQFREEILGGVIVETLRKFLDTFLGNFLWKFRGRMLQEYQQEFMEESWR